jgi:hypothetical protein
MLRMKLRMNEFTYEPLLIIPLIPSEKMIKFIIKPYHLYTYKRLNFP